jgi:hypothetical protein
MDQLQNLSAQESTTKNPPLVVSVLSSLEDWSMISRNLRTRLLTKLRTPDDIDIRIIIYSKMLSACSEEARAELKKDERFQGIQSISSGWINVSIIVPQGIQREKSYNEYSRMQCAQRNKAGCTIHRVARLGQVLALKGLCTELSRPAQNYGISCIRVSKRVDCEKVLSSGTA